jgi:hypothetical protein
MKIRLSRLCATASAALSLIAAAPSAFASTLYEDFSATLLNPAKWSGEERSQAGATLVEARRAILSGVLRIEAKGYGDKFSDAGAGRVSNQVTLGNSASVTDLKATVTPRTALFTSCAGNVSAPGAVWLGITGGFFNAGQSAAGGRYNDVQASIEIHRESDSADASGVMHVTGKVTQCADNACVASTPLGSTDLGTTTLNTPTDLHVTWDQPGHRFTFQKNTESVQSVAYAVADTNPPRQSAKRLGVSADIANCSAQRIYSYGGADFDNVYTNP